MYLIYFFHLFEATFALMEVLIQKVGRN
ncbi:hypothetical protein Anas_02895 [Armadillidium nasatum]|uniref:Uncharacterized protein n=1 Tax=Armadillidium nasatum TaxID=96803 RepID=A0A5N5TJ89_9CRUS|nr:hypothetical protein Anas_02895 [Armadillidium nasatum]